MVNISGIVLGNTYQRLSTTPSVLGIRIGVMGSNLSNLATDLQVPLMKTFDGQRAFSFHGARVWNHLDSEVKQAPSFKAFRGAVKMK